MTLLFLFLIASAALLYFRAAYHEAPRQVYVFKPLTTLLIGGLALAAPPSVPAPYQAFIGAGLALSLLGDVLLMLPSDRFVAGLASFLMAHLSYLAAFYGVGGVQPAVGWLVLLLLGGAGVGWLLWPHLGALRGPVAVYGLVLLAMAWQAGGMWQAVGTPAALCALAGALLFVLSDAVLAVNRFVRPFPAAQAVVMGTYYLAQTLLALSV